MFLAYIDPGSGLLLWQGIVAAFVGLIFYLKQTRKWIARQFRRLMGRADKVESAELKTPPDGQSAA